ncbi:MAG: DUF3857 domain-containing protein [Candidatus Acidiferrales bacterium]
MSPSRRNAAQIVAFTVLFAVAASVMVTRHASAEDWLPVPPADLSMKDNPAEPGADAMILYRNSHVDARRAAIDGQYVEEYIRIKIFTQHGADQESIVNLRYWKNESQIKDIRARTIRPDGSIVGFDGQVFEKVVEGTSDSRELEKSFTLPQVSPGSIVEYMYRRTYKPDYVYAQTWTISERLFTRDAVFSIAPYSPRSSMDPTRYFRTTGLPAGALPQRQGNGTHVMEVHNLPGITEESLMPPARTLEARVEFFYRNAGQAANMTAEQFWNGVGQRWSGEIDKFANKKGALQQVISQTVAAGDTPEQKLRELYERTQKVPNLSYQDEKTKAERKVENIKPNENVEDVLKHNCGNDYQINMLFLGLARTAGFQANAVYIAMRDREVFIPGGQNVDALGTQLIWVRAGDAEYWLDPAALYYPFGLLPWNETESKGIRISKNGAEFVATPAVKSGDATLIRHAELNVSDDGSAGGTFEVEYTGLEAAMRRSYLHSEDDAGRKKNLETELKWSLPQGADVEVTQISDWDDTSKPLRVSGTLKISTFGSAAGHRLLVPVSAFLTSYRDVFQHEKRVNAIRFEMRREEFDDVTLHAPAGYTMEALPPAKALKAGPSFSYEMEATQHGTVLETKRHFAISAISFPRDQYSALRSYILNVKSNDEAQVVLNGSAAVATPSTTTATTSKN